MHLSMYVHMYSRYVCIHVCTYVHVRECIRTRHPPVDFCQFSISSSATGSRVGQRRGLVARVLHELRAPGQLRESSLPLLPLLSRQHSLPQRLQWVKLRITHRGGPTEQGITVTESSLRLWSVYKSKINEMHITPYVCMYVHAHISSTV